MYQLDTEAARKGDNRGGYIREIGAYIGTFTRAEELESQKGTRGIGFTFITDDKQRADLQLYTEKADGTQIMGYDTLMSIMTCMKLRGIDPKPGSVMKWDRDAGKEIETRAMLFHDLMNKPIGLMLQTRDYEKLDGSIGTAMEIAYAFQAGTNFFASEILDKVLTPERFDKAFVTLKHRPLKGAKPVHTKPAGGFEDMDDSIPF